MGLTLAQIRVVAAHHLFKSLTLDLQALHGEKGIKADFHHDHSNGATRLAGCKI